MTNTHEAHARLFEIIKSKSFVRGHVVLASGKESDHYFDMKPSMFDPEGAEILAHGVAVRPGKPTLLARVGEKPLMGLPGHPVSAMVIFHILGRPLLDKLSGRVHAHRPAPILARLTRNLASAQGREDYVRVTLEERDGERWAIPVLGGSGLIRTLVKAQGLVRVDAQSEGIYQGEWVEVEVFP